MKGLYYITSTLLLLPLLVTAQDVVVHSDPRLSAVLKKQHTEEIASAAVATQRRAAAKTTHPSPADVSARALAVNTPAAAAKPGDITLKPGAVASVALYGPAAAKTEPLPATVKGHAAGWTPPVRNVKVIYSGKGFRVQIYNGTDRARALAIKSEFIRNNPGVRTYLTFTPPCFRVKVGNYRNRSDAVGMWREANSTYNPSMIVPDIITISTF